MRDLNLQGAIQGQSWYEVAVRAGVALLCGLIVIAIYRSTRPPSHVNSTFPPTLLLLAVLIAIVAQVIGNNVALAFSLVGALSIVRFRTVVRDTQDTAFVIFSVVIGMAAGVGAFTVAAIGLVTGGLAAAIMRTKSGGGWTDSDASLLIRVNLGADPTKLLTPTFQKFLAESDVTGVVTAKQGAAIDYTYRVRLKSEVHPSSLVKELNQLDGVQTVELRRTDSADF